MTELNKKKYSAICFLQEDKGRDTEIVLPIVIAAEKFLNCSIDFVIKWNAHKIYLEKPDFIIVPANCIGSKMYHDIAKYAYSMNLKIFSFISEGNFNVANGHNFFGFNDDRFFYQDYVLNWSQRTIDYMTKVAPAQKEKYVLTGAPGFDRYKIYKFISKQDFLKKYNYEKFNKVVLYSGWAFGKLQYQQGQEELEPDEIKRPEKLRWVEDQRVKVRDALRFCIEENPDILFLLKQHPAEYYPGLTFEQCNEMSELAHYANVEYITGHSEGIHDLISACDLLLGFETTSAVETWMMSSKPTIFVNPEVNFPRVDIYEGCTIAKNGSELNNFIHEYFNTGEIVDFNTEELRQNRRKIIASSIGFSDGMNHLRSLYYLNKTLQDIDLAKINWKSKKEFKRLYYFFLFTKPFYKIGILTKLPWFSKFNWVFERYKLENIPVLKKRYKVYIDEYYLKNGINKKTLVDFWNSEAFNQVKY